MRLIFYIVFGIIFTMESVVCSEKVLPDVKDNDANLDEIVQNSKEIILEPDSETSEEESDVAREDDGVSEECSCGKRYPKKSRRLMPRIVGGETASSGEVPWRSAVLVFNKTSLRGNMCAGTVISRNWILTAAHCTRAVIPGVHGITVYVGAHENPLFTDSGTPVIVDRYIQHPNFVYRIFDNDIALLHLQKPLQFGAKVAPACLPFGSTLEKSSFHGAKVLASGWGTTKLLPLFTQNTDPTSDILRKVELPLLTVVQCLKLQTITKNQLCTYLKGADTCQGDSGGTIDLKHSDGRYYSIGVVSFGHGCGQKNHPGVYTKVNNYLDWIEEVTGEDFCKP